MEKRGRGQPVSGSDRRNGRYVTRNRRQAGNLRNEKVTTMSHVINRIANAYYSRMIHLYYKFEAVLLLVLILFMAFVFLKLIDVRILLLPVGISCLMVTFRYAEFNFLRRKNYDDERRYISYAYAGQKAMFTTLFFIIALMWLQESQMLPDMMTNGLLFLICMAMFLTYLCWGLYYNLNRYVDWT